MFLKICMQGNISLIKIKNLQLLELLNTIKDKYNIDEVTFFTSDKIIINHEDIVEYITQYINTDSNFILYLNEPSQKSCPSNDLCNILPKEVNDTTINIEDLDIITSQYLISNNIDDKESLKQFVETNHQIIFKKFEKSQKLENSDRIALSKSIIQHLLKDPNRILSTIDLEKLAILLSEVFVGELASTFYQKYCRGRHACGKLHDAYNNYRNNLAKAGIIVRRSKSKSATPSDCLKELDINNPGTDKILEELTVEVDVDLIKLKWELTFESRNKLLSTKISTAEYIKKFPGLEQKEGYKLLYIDVLLKYKKELNPYFPSTFLESLTKTTKNSKSDNITAIINFINVESEESKKLSLSLMLLPFAIPTAIRRSKKGIQKATKAEIADTFILHFLTCGEADSGVRKLIKKRGEGKELVQPFMVFIGSPIELSWVVVTHVKYTFTDPLEAVKACMSIYLALNISYPKISEKIWLFVQLYIFNIATPYDVVDATVKTFANDLKFKQNE